MIWLLFILLISCAEVQSQSVDGVQLYSDQLEDLAQSEEAEPEDDHSWQQMQYFAKNPVALNGPADQLIQLPLLNSMLVENLSRYRMVLGDLVSVYELQAVPGFTIEIIKAIEPFITLNHQIYSSARIREWFREGESNMLLRPHYSLRLPEGFTTQKPEQRFIGDPLHLLLRYKYNFRNLLQYGFTLEKDAGENLIVPGKFPLTDFHSLHMILRQVGAFKTIAFGDYSVNLGQGLIQWQSQAFGKTSQVLNIKRQSEVIRPYQSTGEFNFYRGGAVTFRNRIFEGTVFISSRKLTANTTVTGNSETVITFFNSSGLHRSPGELADRNSISYRSAGGNMRVLNRSGHAGINIIAHEYSSPLNKRDEPYNIYGVKGRHWGNVSADFAQTYRNAHCFGEIATDKSGNLAAVAGVISSMHRNIDVAFLYRNIEDSYQAITAKAFTENTFPQNEKGIYTGFSLRPSIPWKFDMYADMFSFSWLKFRVEAPSSGVQYMLQLAWKPNRQTELYCRYRKRIKPVNAPGNHVTDYPVGAAYTNTRTHLNVQLSKTLTIRNRLEFSTYQPKTGGKADKGYLFFTDLICKPAYSRFAFNTRFQYFECDSYDARIYAFENDVLWSGSTPAFFEAGLRFYVNFRGNFTIRALKNNVLSISMKAAKTLYNRNSQALFPLTTAPAADKSDIRLQLLILPK